MSTKKSRPGPRRRVLSSPKGAPPPPEIPTPATGKQRLGSIALGVGIALAVASIALPYIAPEASARLGATVIYGMRVAGILLVLAGWFAGRNQPKGPKAKIREPL